MTKTEHPSHVVLIRTPPLLPATSVTAQQGVPSLALAYLGAALKERGHRVTYIDSLGENLTSLRPSGVSGLFFLGLSSDEIVERIPRDADVIGVSCMFSNDWIYSRKIIEAIHRQHPSVPMISGGEHASAEPESVLNAAPSVRACAIGEGEETIIELVEAIHGGKTLSAIAGIAYLNDSGQTVRTPKRERNDILDALPWPDWEGLPIRNYLNAGLGMAAQGVRTMPMLGTRGCPFRCTFCSAPDMWNAEWRKRRNIAEIAQEARTYIDRYGVEHLEFYDMSPSIDRHWLDEFCNEIGKLNVTWNFPAGMRTEILTPETLLKMKKSGCYKMTFALETSVPHLIKSLKKNTKPKKILPLIRAAVKVGLISKANFIWGLPGQRKRDILTDYLFLVRIAFAGLHDATCFAFVPYPGSALHKELLAQGKIKKGPGYDEFLAFNVYNNPLRMKSWSDRISHRQLSFWTLGGMAVFYSSQFIFRPVRLLGLLRALFQRSPVTMLELALSGLARKTVLRFQTASAKRA